MVNRGGSVTTALLFASVVIILAKGSLGSIANRVRTIAGVPAVRENNNGVQ